MNHQKGVYFDGHERNDVVAYRKVFLGNLTELDRRYVYGDHSPILFLWELPLVPIHHDEYTFFANAVQYFYWGDDYRITGKFG